MCGYTCLVYYRVKVCIQYGWADTLVDPDNIAAQTTLLQLVMKAMEHQNVMIFSTLKSSILLQTQFLILPMPRLSATW